MPRQSGRLRKSTPEMLAFAAEQSTRAAQALSIKTQGDLKNALTYLNFQWAANMELSWFRENETLTWLNYIISLFDKGLTENQIRTMNVIDFWSGFFEFMILNTSLVDDAMAQLDEEQRFGRRKPNRKR